MDAGGYECINGRLYDIVINATSASMRAELPPVPASEVPCKRGRSHERLGIGVSMISADFSTPQARK
jgi:hypothetical protein